MYKLVRGEDQQLSLRNRDTQLVNIPSAIINHQFVSARVWLLIQTDPVSCECEYKHFPLSN